MRWKSTVGGRFFCGGSEGVDVGPLRVGRQFPASLAFDWSRENTLELSNDKKSPSKKSTNSISPQVLVTTWLKVLRFTKQLRKSGGFFLEGGFLFFLRIWSELESFADIELQFDRLWYLKRQWKSIALLETYILCGVKLFFNP